MIIGVDTTNVKSDGGITYLLEFIHNLAEILIDDDRVVLWLNREMSEKVCNNHPCITKVIKKELGQNLLKRVLWQATKLAKEAKNRDCDILFVMSGSYLGNFPAFVTVNQNLLPFEYRELLRYGLSKRTIKFIISRWLQIYTYQRARGVIFLSKYAQECVHKGASKMLLDDVKSTVIPHTGHNYSFVYRDQRAISEYDNTNPYEIVYISSIEPYKHHTKVVEAVAYLRKQGFPLRLRFIGQAYKASLRALDKIVDFYDAKREWVIYNRHVDYDCIEDVYHEMDMMIFASTCETFGIPLMEAMKAGLPIVCSNQSSMYSSFGDKLFYFDPLSKYSMINVLQNTIESPKLRTMQVKRNYDWVKNKSWKKVSVDTYEFISSCIYDY